MPVICTLLTAYGTVHTTDSLLTVPRGDGSYWEKETQRSKIAKFEKCRGAASY
jgi:hypothetical protein